MIIPFHHLCNQMVGEKMGVFDLEQDIGLIARVDNTAEYFLHLFSSWFAKFSLFQGIVKNSWSWNWSFYSSLHCVKIHDISSVNFWCWPSNLFRPTQWQAWTVYSRKLHYDFYHHFQWGEILFNLIAASLHRLWKSFWDGKWAMRKKNGKIKN